VLGWKTGGADWSCPAGFRMPRADEWAAVQPHVPASDAAQMNEWHDVAFAVGGCGCEFNFYWCGEPSIDTLRLGRMCGDMPQLHVCLAYGTNAGGRRRSLLLQQRYDDGGKAVPAADAPAASPPPAPLLRGVPAASAASTPNSTLAQAAYRMPPLITPAELERFRANVAVCTAGGNSTVSFLAAEPPPESDLMACFAGGRVADDAEICKFVRDMSPSELNIAADVALRGAAATARDDSGARQ
jgi:hypothetical protein